MKSLIHQLALGLWAIRPEAVSAYMQRVDDIFAGTALALEDASKSADERIVPGIYFVTPDGEELELNISRPVPAVNGMVAVVDISGPIMKDDFCGDLGMVSLAKWYEHFEATPQITGVVELMDSPGGHSNAMMVLAQQKMRMKKPVVTMVNAGMACSAAYGIAATSDLILSSGPMDEFGSIGTYMQIRDFRAGEQARGVKTHTIIATRSGQKLSAYHEALKADPNNIDDPHYKQLRETRVDPFNETFIALIQQARPGVKDEAGVFEGQVFPAARAMELGLIDGTNKTMNDALVAVRTLAKQKPN